MNKVKEIGTPFTVKGQKYKAIESKTNSCTGCAFIRSFCTRLSLGPCGASSRPDNKFVIFVPANDND